MTKVIFSLIEALIRNLDDDYFERNLSVSERKMLGKQGEKAKFILDHAFYQQKANKLRVEFGVPEIGFDTEEQASIFLKQVNKTKFITKICELLEEHHVTNRWFMVFGYNVLLNTSDIPLRFIPPAMEMYIPNDRNRLIVEIFKDTTYSDIKHIWDVIKQQQNGLKPDIATRSNKVSSAMVWDESRRKFDFVTTSPSKVMGTRNELYEFGKFIYNERSRGLTYKKIAQKFGSKKYLTTEDVAKAYNRYKKVLADTYLQ